MTQGRMREDLNLSLVVLCRRRCRGWNRLYLKIRDKTSVRNIHRVKVSRDRRNYSLETINMRRKRFYTEFSRTSQFRQQYTTT